MSNKQSKSKNQHSSLNFLAAGFLIISLVFVAITFFLLSRHAKNEHRWTSLTTDVQVTSQQLASYAGEAAFGKLAAFLDLDDSHKKMVSTIEELRAGSVTGELPATPPAVDAQMKQLNQAWSRMDTSVTRILEYNDRGPQSRLAELRGAADDVFLDSRDVFVKSSNLKQAIAELSQTRIWPSLTTGMAGLAAMIVIVWLLLYPQLTSERRRAAIATKAYKKEHKNNKRAVSRLLEETKPLSSGDLTMQASVTEEFTSDVAQLLNYAIDQLRELIRRIGHTSRQVASTAVKTRDSTSELAKSATLQAKQVGQAKETIQEISASLDAIAKRSLKYGESSGSPADIAHAGGEKNREAINRINMVQDQTQQTTNRIKRLAESTQEIRDTIEMINGFADQTNMLALNAAIQAASPGGGGKGLADAADEVHQLAESTTDAAGRVATLVQTIQTDAHEAAVSLESTTSEMVIGTSLVEDAGNFLEQIKMVSEDLFHLISEIAKETSAQSSAAAEIHGLMEDVQEVSIITSEGSTQIALSVEEAAASVMQLSDSVADFKLPEDD